MIKGLYFCLFTVSSMLWAQSEDLPPALVRAQPATAAAMAAHIQVPGTVVSRHDARVAAEVDGVLITVADVGASLAEGEVVARIEDTIPKLRETELKAQLAREQARLTFLLGEQERLERLALQNNAARTQLEQVRADREVAFNDKAIAAARLAQVQDQLSRTLLRAPFDGVVAERLRRAGERVTVDTVVVRMLDPKHLEVIARAPLQYMAYLSPGDPVTLQLGTDTALGTVRTLVAVGNENTHLFETRIDLVGVSVPVGQTVRLNLPASETQQVLAVPRDALVLRPDGVSVFVMSDDKKVRQVSVIPGLGSGSLIAVQGNISAGEMVITRGNERLRPGQTVILQQAPGGAASAGR